MEIKLSEHIREIEGRLADLSDESKYSDFLKRSRSLFNTLLRQVLNDGTENVEGWLLFVSLVEAYVEKLAEYNIEFAYDLLKIAVVESHNLQVPFVWPKDNIQTTVRHFPQEFEEGQYDIAFGGHSYMVDSCCASFRSLNFEIAGGEYITLGSYYMAHIGCREKRGRIRRTRHSVLLPSVSEADSLLSRVDKKAFNNKWLLEPFIDYVGIGPRLENSIFLMQRVPVGSEVVYLNFRDKIGLVVSNGLLPDSDVDSAQNVLELLGASLNKSS